MSNESLVKEFASPCDLQLIEKMTESIFEIDTPGARLTDENTKNQDVIKN